MKILVVPGNMQTAKSYPHWAKFYELAKAHEIRRIENVEIPLPQVVALVNWCDVWISIDSFLQHLVHYHQLKPGIVLWGKSDPLIFGHPRFVNLLKDRKYLRPEQFRWWKDEPVDPDAFVEPEVIMREIERIQAEQSA